MDSLHPNCPGFMTLRPVKKEPGVPPPLAPVKPMVYEVVEISETSVVAKAESGETEQIPIAQLQRGLADSVYITMHLQKQGGVWVQAELPTVPASRAHEYPRPQPIAVHAQASYRREPTSAQEPPAGAVSPAQPEVLRLPMAFRGNSGKVFKVEGDNVRFMMNNKLQTVSLSQIQNPDLLQKDATIQSADNDTWIVLGDPRLSQSQIIFPHAQQVKPGFQRVGKPGVNGNGPSVPRDPQGQIRSPAASPLISSLQIVKPSVAPAAPVQSAQQPVPAGKVGPQFPSQANPSATPPQFPQVRANPARPAPMPPLQGAASPAPPQPPSMRKVPPQPPSVNQVPPQPPSVNQLPPQQAVQLPRKPGTAPPQANPAAVSPPQRPLQPGMPSAGAKPGVNAPMFLARSSQVVAAPPTITIITVFQEGKVQASVDATHESLEIPISAIVSKDGKPVQHSQLGQGMKLIRTPENLYKVMGELRQQHNYLDPEMLGEVYGRQQTDSMRAVSEFVAERFDGIFCSRGKSISRSLSVYICQCMLFEDLLIKQKKMQSFQPVISRSLNLQLPYSPLNLKHKDFESTYSEAIEKVEQVVAPMFTMQENLDFAPIANKLRVWIFVLKPQGSRYECERFYPENAKSCKMQKVVLIGKPPYPVAVSRKLGALFDSPDPLEISIEHFVLHELAYEPPKPDLALTQDLQKLKVLNEELNEMDKSVPEFAATLLRRFEEMIQSGELGQRFCSGEYAHAVYEMWKKLHEMSAGFPLLASFLDIMGQTLNTNWAFFNKPCDRCQSGLCDWALECDHKLCARCIGEIIQAAAAAGPVLQAREENTTVSCPICGKVILKKTVKENDSTMYGQLMGYLENASNCVTCTQCSQTVPRHLCFNPECGHTSCYKCLRELVYCKCGTELKAAWNEMNLAQLSCDRCQAAMRVYDLPPVLCSQSHTLCMNCAYLSCKSKKCAAQGCGKLYSKQDLEALKGWALPKCKGCLQALNATEFIDTICDCWVCRTCAVSFANQYHSIGSCWYCQEAFAESTRKFLMESMSPENLAQCCCFCYSGVYNEMELACGDKAHWQCIKAYVMKCEDTGDRMECGFCPVELYPDVVYTCVQYTDIPKYCQLQTTECRWVCSNCKKSDETYPNIDPETNQAYPVECASCGTWDCILCAMKCTADHTCAYVFGRLKAKELEKHKKCAVMCPKCRIAAVREVNPVQRCNICETEFCSECVVSMLVIRAHGNSYHRPDCSRYTGELLGSAFNEDCPCCQFFGHTECEPPKRLRRRGIPPPGINF